MQNAPWTFDTGAATDVGKVRDRNEDSYLVLPDAGIWAVADGMGGHAAGDVASSTVIDALRSIGRPVSAADLLARCEQHVVSANTRLRELGNRRGAIIGTTITVLLTFDRDYACVWSGDSRLYRVRAGEITQISRDHTEVQELVTEGALTREEAMAWRGRNAVTRAIGVYDPPELDIDNGVLEPGDIFVLCSDGMTAYVSDDEIRDCVLTNGSQSACDALIALTLERGAVDNVTVIVVRCEPGMAPVMRPGAEAGSSWE